MKECTLGELAFERLHRPRHRPALSDADDLVLGNVGLDQCIQDRAQARGVAADLVQQPGHFAARDDVGHVVHVVADHVDQRQVAVLGEVPEPRRLTLAALQHGRMRPGMRPEQPLPRFLVAADHRKAQ
ncbi:hypothetical protein D3C87_1271170 [compost metagenome]